MVKPFFKITINDIALARDEYFDIEISDNIFDILPTLKFKLNDSTGTHIARLDIYPGAVVKVVLLDLNSSEAIMSTDFIIYKVYDGQEFKNNLGGFLQIFCHQAWQYFGDSTSKAYAPQKISAIIKKLCEDAKTDASVFVEDENFEESTEGSTLPRYKCYENELQFITKKLLPYLIVQNSNGLFFIDYKGNAHLSSFNTLFSKSEKIFLATRTTSLDDKYNFPDIADKKGVKGFYYYDDIDFTIGNAEGMKALKEYVAIEFALTAQEKIVNVDGVKTLSLFAKDSEVSNTIPFNAIQYSSLSSTNNYVICNKSKSDGLCLVINDDEDLNGFLSVTITLNSSIMTEAGIGDTVFLHTPYWHSNDEEEKKHKVHWTTCKWLIASQKLNMNGKDPANTTQVLTLVRPTLGFSKSTTTIKQPERFVEV